MSENRDEKESNYIQLPHANSPSNFGLVERLFVDKSTHFKPATVVNVQTGINLHDKSVLLFHLPKKNGEIGLIKRKDTTLQIINIKPVIKLY